MKLSIIFTALLAGAVTALPIFVDCENQADVDSAAATGLRCRNNPGDTNSNNPNTGNANFGDVNSGNANSGNGNSGNSNAQRQGSVFIDCETQADFDSAAATGLRCRNKRATTNANANPSDPEVHAY